MASEPKKAVIYVFSGTGNTKIAADMTAAALEKRGFSTTVFRIRRPFEAAPDPREYDLCGFAYPIHAFNAPQFLLRFVKSLPPVESKRCFIFRVSGEPFKLNDASSYWLNKRLRKKGFLPTGDDHLLMPYNIMFRYRDALAKQMYLHTEKQSERVAQKAVEGGERLRFNPFAVMWSAVLRLQWFGAWVNGPLIHTKKKKCTLCGRCVRECPANNITVKNGRCRFGAKCTMCMSCAYGCPADAVRPGFLNPWRVNPPFDYKKILDDETIPCEYINSETKGYFKLFRSYYKRTE